MGKLVCGFGTNDADYQVTKYENGKMVWRCPFYKKWKSMITRSYCPKYHQRNPSYIDVTVCYEWLTFSSFKSWMLTQDWEGKELDKDLLFKGSKVYSPEACAFVDRVTNVFATDRGAMRGKYMLGVHWDKSSGRFQSKCRNPFTVKQEYLGVFTTELEAHKAWKQRKHELAIKLAEQQTDERVAQALRVRYL